MSQLNDTQKSVVVVDFDLTEKIIWDYQSTHNPVKTLSYGVAGVYAIKLVDSPNGKTWKAGEVADRYLPYYLDSITPEEEIETVKTGRISGTRIESSNKGKLAISSYGRGKEFESRITVKTNWAASDINRWKSYWRLACAFDQKYITRLDLQDLKPKAGLESSEKWAFVLENWRKMNPEALRAAWANVKPAEVVNVSDNGNSKVKGEAKTAVTVAK